MDGEVRRKDARDSQTLGCAGHPASFDTDAVVPSLWIVTLDDVKHHACSLECVARLRAEHAAQKENQTW